MKRKRVDRTACLAVNKVVFEPRVRRFVVSITPAIKMLWKKNTQC